MATPTGEDRRGREDGTGGPGPTSPRGERKAPNHGNAARLFGYDIFISFAWVRRLAEQSMPPISRAACVNATSRSSSAKTKPRPENDWTARCGLPSIAPRPLSSLPIAARWMTRVGCARRSRSSGRAIRRDPSCQSAWAAPFATPRSRRRPETGWASATRSGWTSRRRRSTTGSPARRGHPMAMAPTRVRSNVKWRRVVRAAVATLVLLVLALGSRPK